MLTRPSPRAPRTLLVAACRRVAVAAGLAIAATVAPVRLAGQEAGSPMPATPGAAEARDEANAAQRRFNQVHRSGLPIEERRGPSRCDARIGRYCYWYDSTAQPPTRREPERVTEARQRLLSVLDSLGVASPQDRWITGQRVRYLIDARDTTAAVQVAMTECRIDGWWCDALLGYAQHVAGSDDAAQRTFDRVLAAMDSTDRCAWENPAVLLDRAVREQVQRLSCPERRRVTERLWWLGAPQLGRAGSDIRSEFFARRVASALEADAEFLYDSRWSWEADELLLRYGWSTWWTRERDVTTSGPSELQLVGHSRVPAFDFLPSGRAIVNEHVPLRNGDWERGGASPAMRYAPHYLKWWRDASAQLAYLRRGDTLLVVAAFEAPPDSMLRDARAVLVLSAGPRTAAHTSQAKRGALGVLQARMPRPSAGTEIVASVEVVDTTRRAMARYRASVIQPRDARLVMSDLLLHRPREQPPAVIALHDVLDAMLPATTIAGDRVGVFWETYGVHAAGAMLDVALTIERVDVPWLRRAAARLRLAEPVTPVQIRWKEPPRATGGVAAQSVSVNVANLAHGEYRLRIRVERGDGARATSERVVRIAGR